MEGVDSINQHKDERALLKMRGSGCDYSLGCGVQRKAKPQSSCLQDQREGVETEKYCLVLV